MTDPMTSQNFDFPSGTLCIVQVTGRVVKIYYKGKVVPTLN
jgi:hypothetical protein